MQFLYVLLALLYVVWPIDLVPDLIPIIGWIDDLVALGYVGYVLISSD